MKHPKVQTMTYTEHDRFVEMLELKLEEAEQQIKNVTDASLALHKAGCEESERADRAEAKLAAAEQQAKEREVQRNVHIRLNKQLEADWIAERDADKKRLEAEDTCMNLLRTCPVFSRGLNILNDWNSKKWKALAAYDSLTKTADATDESPNTDIALGRVKSFPTVDGMLDSLKKPWDTTKEPGE